MFEQYDLDLSLKKGEYEQEIPRLRERLGVLQRTLRDRGVPTVILVEGWRASGISSAINKLTYALDPRGYRVYPIQEPSDIEREHPLIWRFWVKTPEKGQIAIFDRSWYSRILIEFLDSEDDKVPPGILEDAIAMEDQLEADDALIIRLFLHIDRKEQKHRLQKMEEKHPEILTKPHGIHGKLKEYDHLLPYIENLLIKSDRPSRPWTIVEATDKHYTTVKVYRTIIGRMEEEIRKQEANANTSQKMGIPKFSKESLLRSKTNILAKVDLKKSLPEEEYHVRLSECQRQLGELQFMIHQKKIPVILVFEGWDAAGKGGAIIRINQALNSRCSIVEPISAPLPGERNHHYLWRFYQRFPKNGTITIFDRSWYGRVLVERVEGLATREEWSRAYQEINSMEESLVGNGTILHKFWLHIDKDTQLARFHERESDPLKKYKITDEDWRNRKKWDAYEVAIEEMLQKTSSPAAPWTIVESNDKYYSRVTIMESIIRDLEKRLKV